MHGYDCRGNFLLLIAAIWHSGLRTANSAAAAAAATTKEIFDYFSCFQAQI
jgi:hypothetical protein